MAIKPFFEDECRIRNRWPNVVELNTEDERRGQNKSVDSGY